MVVVIWGVSGVGKTTIANLLARELGWSFYDADDFHSAANIEKMERGEPLTDEDRQPWLETLRGKIRDLLAANGNAVIACSALKRKYRETLRVNKEVKFVFLQGDFQLVSERLRNRRGHFMNPDLLRSQFADLEEPGLDEQTIVVDVTDAPEEIVREIKRRIS